MKAAIQCREQEVGKQRTTNNGRQKIEKGGSMRGIYLQRSGFWMMALMLAGSSYAQERTDVRSDLVITAEGKVVQDAPSSPATSPRTFTPSAPVARLNVLSRSKQNPVAQFKSTTGSIGGFKNPDGTSESTQCVVDFSDYEALNRLIYADEGHPIYAENTFTFTPWWFQACNPVDHAVVRPIHYSHYHLSYEDPHIMPCPGSLVDWGIIQDDGSCEQIDPRAEPRRLNPHDHLETIALYVWDGNQKRIFDLKSIRVLGPSPVRLCYKPVQEDDGAWETSEPGGSTTPGIWFCWDELHTGNWDLSAFADFITDVKLGSVQGQGIFSVDDIVLQVQ